MTDKQALRARQRRHSEAADWVFRNREAGQTAEDAERFRNWLGRDAENCRAYEAAERLLGEARTAIQGDPALRDFEVKPAGLARPVAGIVATVVVATTLFFMADGPLHLEADMVAGSGEMPIVTLSDGSIMQLNASSAVAYDFDATRRTIRLLRGQAFFEVAKDRSRPFVVEAGDARVTALGTAFDVRIGAQDTDVTVTESTVLLEPGTGGQDGVRVTQGQQGTLDRSTGKAQVRDVDGIVALAWRRGQLAVDNAPLSLVVEEMNRHFAGRIMLVGNDVAHRRVSGTIAVADTGAALSFIEQALRLRVTRVGPLIVIRG